MKTTYKTAEEWVENVLPQFRGKLTLDGEVVVAPKSKYTTLGFIARSITHKKVAYFGFYETGVAIGLPDELELERLERAINAQRCIFTGNLLVPKLRDKVLEVLGLEDSE